MTRLNFLQSLLAFILAPFGYRKKELVPRITATITGLPLEDLPIRAPKRTGLLLTGYCDGKFTYTNMTTGKTTEFPIEIVNEGYFSAKHNGRFLGAKG